MAAAATAHHPFNHHPTIIQQLQVSHSHQFILLRDHSLFVKWGGGLMGFGWGMQKKGF